MTEEIRELVREKYAQAITKKTGCCCGSGSGCCSGIPEVDAQNIITGGLYQENEAAGILQDLATASFGCGNPTALAELQAGEIVLDLGSGAGLDVLLSAKRVGPTGRVYGLDMTDEMLEAAGKNQIEAGITNVEFLKGYLEDIPLADNSLDVIISNCVINLSADKTKVLQEAYRVLKPGGRFAVSDIVLTRPLPAKIKQDSNAWTGCVAGALVDKEYQEKLKSVGFNDISIEITRRYDLTSEAAEGLVPMLSEKEKEELNGSIVSAFIRAKK